MSASNLHVIVGLGATGLSCARYLKEKGVPFAVTDTREVPPFLPHLKQIAKDTETSFGKIDSHLLDKAETIVLSPGIALHEEVIAKQIKRGVPVIGDIELFAKAVNSPVIAITGTNAKSTVTTLVGKMAESAGYQVGVGGNLGIPVLDLMTEVPHANLFVLELSSFQLETTHSLKARVSSILNITPDHMDRYSDLKAYTSAKHRIYKQCQIAVCNRDDLLTECNDPSLQNKFYFTLGTPSANEFGLIEKAGLTYLAFEKQLLLNVSDLPVSGKHYQANALASLAIGHAFGFPIAPMLNVLREFKGLPHRCQFIRKYRDVSWYNDSKGTNVGATFAAILGLGSDITGKLVLIAGGVGKNADFSTLAPAIRKYARHVVLLGEAADDIAKALSDHESDVDVSFVNSMDEAVQKAAAVALPNDSVLLSPACASFDMFKNYEHRGEVFTEIVSKLI
jgi:UDP-N-acetylmuramoylalanine--D-glutamate ligase